MKWLSDMTNIPYSTLKRKIGNQTEWRSGEIDSVLLVTGKTYEELFLRGDYGQADIRQRDIGADRRNS